MKSVNNKIERQSNIELLRMFLMLMIIAGHVIMFSGKSSEMSGVDYFIANFIRSFTTMAVDCFVLISGYFGINASVKGYLRISLQTWFYSVSILVICILAGIHSFDAKDDIQFLAPVATRQWWYITIYLVLYVISPWINKLVNIMSKVNFKKLLIVLFFVFCLLPTFCYSIGAQTITNDAGYGICNFIFLYLIGRYLRLHFDNKYSKYVYLALWIVCGFLLFASNLVLSKIFGFHFNSFISYDTLCCFCGSIFLFLFFVKLNINSKIINKTSKNVLAVYIIHLHPALSEYLFVNLLKCDDVTGWKYLLTIILYPILLFVVFLLVEVVRKILFTRLETVISIRIEKSILNLKERLIK